MERLLTVFPSPAQPLWVRIGVSTAIMVVCCAIQVMLNAYVGSLTLFVLLPGIFFSGLFYGRGISLYATALGTLSAIVFMPPDTGIRAIAPLSMFAAIGFGTAILSGLLRKTLERLAASERAKDVLLRELHHRTKNNMSIMAALLRTQARASSNRETQDALVAASRRINIMGALQEFLRPAKNSVVDPRIALGDYLRELSQRLEEMRGDPAVNIFLNAENVEVPERIALPVGIIINELVTNSLKYAYPSGRRGTVEIRVWTDGALIVEVSDDGVGCPEDAKPGVGSRLMEAMAKQVRGTVERPPSASGCKTTVRIPHEET